MPLDQFYTKDKIAEECYSEFLNILKDNNIICLKNENKYIF